MSRLYDILPIPLQNLACSAAGWGRSRSRFTSHFYKTLEEWERSGDGPIEELVGIQRRRLENIVKVARTSVPHYRNLNFPTDPAATTEEILRCIPILEKSEYARHPENFVSRSLPRRRIREGKTSGTTGTALRLFFTPEALAEEYAAVWRLRRRSGVRLSDPHLTFGGQLIVPVGQTRPPFWRVNRWNRQVLFSLYHMSESNLPRYVDAIHDSSARYVQGYPSSLCLVARAMLQSGRPLPRGRLVAVFTSSESLLANQRETIEQAFGAPVLDRYGTSEFCVSMTECPKGFLHVDMEFGIVEVEVAEESPDWTRGPLLVTGFANEAAPLLRYRIGDVGTRMKRPVRMRAPWRCLRGYRRQNRRLRAHPRTGGRSGVWTISSKINKTSRKLRSYKNQPKPLRFCSWRATTGVGKTSKH